MQQERVRIKQLLDGLETDYKLRDKFNRKVASVIKPLPDRIPTGLGTTSATDSTYVGSRRRAARAGESRRLEEVCVANVDSSIVRELRSRTRFAENPEQLVESLFALARTQTEAGPLQAYLLACDLDSCRAPENRLKPETVSLMARKFADLSGQYMIFSEFPELNDTSIMSFLHEVISLDNISSKSVRGNAMGIFQANIGLWQILARQGEISGPDPNDSWQRMIKAFGRPVTSTQVFDGGRDSLRELLRASTGRPEGSQHEIISMLAGPHQTNGRRQDSYHTEQSPRSESLSFLG